MPTNPRLFAVNKTSYAEIRSPSQDGSSIEPHDGPESPGFGTQAVVAVGESALVAAGVVILVGTCVNPLVAVDVNPLAAGQHFPAAQSAPKSRYKHPPPAIPYPDNPCRSAREGCTFQVAPDHRCILSGRHSAAPLPPTHHSN